MLKELCVFRPTDTLYTDVPIAGEQKKLPVAQRFRGVSGVAPLGEQVSNLVTDIRQKSESLSPRERHILSMAAQGFADKEIAAKIGISMGTVRTYWQRMRDKTNTHSRSEILSHCMQQCHTDKLGEVTEYRDRLVALFEGAAVGIALIDFDDVIIEANSAFAGLFGISRVDIAGSSFARLSGISRAQFDPEPSGSVVLICGAGPDAAEPHDAHLNVVRFAGEPCYVVTVLPVEGTTRLGRFSLQ